MLTRSCIIIMKIIQLTTILVFIIAIPCHHHQYKVEPQKHTGYMDKRLPRVNDDFVYDFLNSYILKEDPMKKDKWRKIRIEVIHHDQKWESYIQSIDSLLAPGDAEFMMDQITTRDLAWDCSKLNTVNCLDTRKVNAIFSNGMNSWDIFRMEYGWGGIHRYSMPIYNKNKTVLLIEHSGSGGGTLGSCEVYIYKKLNCRLKD